MTVKAPFATPVPCCDMHRAVGWQLGQKAVHLNAFVLMILADQDMRPCWDDWLKQDRWLSRQYGGIVVEHKEETREVMFQELVRHLTGKPPRINEEVS